LGQKVNPIGLRLGIVKTWDSRWFADKKYADYILEDYKIRKFHQEKALPCRRFPDRDRTILPSASALRIFTARPGIVIGKKGSEIAQLKKELEKVVSQEVMIDIQEVRKPEIDAQLVAENVALQIERRVAFRRAMKRGIQSAMRFGAEGRQDDLLRPLGRGRNGPNRMVPRGPRAAAHPAGRYRLRVSPRPTPPMASSVSRCSSSRARF
jgi:small subunit ribosomal protein S3